VAVFDCVYGRRVLPWKGYVMADVAVVAIFLVLVGLAMWCLSALSGLVDRK
jgi:hypothetical protein